MKTSVVQCLLLAAVSALALLGGTALAAGNQQPPATYFLVAQPDLPDPMFRDSVVLMLPSTGTPLVVGLIINKPTKMKLSELFPDNAALKNRSETAYFGGPVDISQPLVLLRTSNAPQGGVPLFKNIYLDLKPHSIVSTLKDSRSLPGMRFYLGRAQWTDEQLHNETLENSWYKVSSDPQYVFSADPNTVWRTLVARAQAIETSAPRLREPSAAPKLLRVTWPCAWSGLDEMVLDR
jgi:putative AlgH/UPF0301 family transcriptional regulator